VLVRNRAALVRAMQATGPYIQYSENRDPMLYTMEMSRRARCIELWATMKFLGASGIGALVDELCENARYFAERLSERGFLIENDVVFNQVLVRCETDEETIETLKRIQQGGVCWCGGAIWNGRNVIRLSVCSWRTSHEDVDTCVTEFVRAS
jgi:glutamate/tyrosine decarboxylase-like PLP-dependent enzyme